ncbi:MAG: peptidoglycan DD-metalloendopeptidase family protein [Lewinellaceae bacterium]|nr:peptidoglycan DD-metalloendopeptidase family protein [Lewinellaceae bacterium]
MPVRYIFCVFLLLSVLSAEAQVNCDTMLPSPANSQYVLPYPAGKTYKIIQGNCPAVGGHANTFALDFNTLTGDTIVACRAGLVIWANDQYADTDWTSGHENNVFIRHNDGTVIRYTHLTQNGALVSANSFVAQGQAIGLSGSSGNTGGVQHLHLQAFRDGTSYDKWNAIPLNFSNADGPLDDQNMPVNGQFYTALDSNLVSVHGHLDVPANLRVFPNPASGIVQIVLHLHTGSNVQLEIADQQGRLVEQLFSGRSGPGKHRFSWDATNAQAGLYFIRLEIDGRSASAKQVLVPK